MAASQPFTIIRETGEALVLDVAMSYTLAATIAVTEHAVEDGTRFSDHAQPQPATLSVRGIVTESPLASQSDVGGRAHVEAAIDFILAIQGERVTVVCDLFGTLESMTLSRYEAPKTKSMDVKFALDFKQVRVASVSYVTIAPEQVATSSSTDATAEETSAESTLPDEVDVGEQGTTSTATNEEQEEADTSYLLDLLEGIGVDI